MHYNHFSVSQRRLIYSSAVMAHIPQKPVHTLTKPGANLTPSSSVQFYDVVQIRPAPTAITGQGSVEEAAASRENEKNISQRLTLEAAEVKKSLGDGNKHRDVSHAVMPMPPLASLTVGAPCVYRRCSTD